MSSLLVLRQGGVLYDACPQVLDISESRGKGNASQDALKARPRRVQPDAGQCMRIPVLCCCQGSFKLQYGRPQALTSQASVL